MPLPNLHMTALEVTHSLTVPEIDAFISKLSPVIESMVNYPLTHQARLIKPLLSYDGAAIALSFLPAAGEGLPHSPTTATSESLEPNEGLEKDRYTYHHLRRDLYNHVVPTGIVITSRYVVPSAHITVGRFLTQADHDAPAKMEKWIQVIEEMNAWLVAEYWPRPKGEAVKEGANGGARIKEGGEWIVGQDQGLTLRKGRLWYGGGETVMLGGPRGF